MGGEGRVRYRHLRRTVIAVLATVAFVLLFGLLIRAILEAEPTRRMAVRWIERVAGGYGAKLEIDDLHWGILPPGVRLRGVSFEAAGITAEVDTLQADLGRVWFTRRTVELGTVAASGVRLSLDGLPRLSGGSRRPFKIRVRHLELDDVEFEGVDLPGGIALDLEGIRAGWVTENGVAQGFTEVAGARVQIGTMEPIDAAIRARFGLSDNGLDFQSYRIEGDGFTLRGNGRVWSIHDRLDAHRCWRTTTCRLRTGLAVGFLARTRRLASSRTAAATGAAAARFGSRLGPRSTTR